MLRNIFKSGLLPFPADLLFGDVFLPDVRLSPYYAAVQPRNPLLFVLNRS
jgi:hypothetical protein